MFGKKTKLTIYSYPEHFVVDGPQTRRANVLNELLVRDFDLDAMPVGTFEYKFVMKGLRPRLVLTRID